MILILGGYFPQNKYDDIISNSKVQVQFSANIFQEKLFNGLKFNSSEKIVFLSAPFINSYPNGYKKIKLEEFASDSEFKYVGFNNLFGFRNISRYLNLKKKINQINFDDNRINVIVYSPHTPLLYAAKYIKEKYDNVSVTLLLPDLPCYMDLSNKRRSIYRFLKWFDNNTFIKLQKYVDKYIFLTEYMSSYLNNKKPYIIVEGLLDYKKNKVKKDIRDYKIITYTGTLNEKFGIKNLVNAFMTLKNPNVRLFICGKGDSEDFIKKCCMNDNRIIYKGLLNSDESRKLQLISDVLVNPRQNVDEFTKYSFPSKNMEYLATFNPVIAYMLDGISDEYKDVFFVPYDNTINALIYTIEKVLNLSDNDLVKYKNKVNEFIKEKDYKNVTKRILDFLNE